MICALCYLILIFIFNRFINLYSVRSSGSSHEYSKYSLNSLSVEPGIHTMHFKKTIKTKVNE